MKVGADFASLTALAALALLGCSRALPPSGAEAGSMRTSDAASRAALIHVVQAQSEAFAAGDFEKARSFAAAALRKQFTVETFRIMITRGYPALLSGRELHFGRASDNGVEALLDVRLTDRDGGRQWLRYALVLESAGWRIVGVAPFRPAGAQASGGRGLRFRAAKHFAVLAATDEPGRNADR